MANTTIPTIDLSPFTRQENSIEPKELSRKDVINKIKQACKEYGFFQVEKHGIPVELMGRALDVSKAFFKFSDEEKAKSSPAHNAPLPAGYFKQPETCVDKNEFFLMFNPLAGFNVYPTNPTDFKEVFEELFSQFAKLASIIEEILSECMGLGPDFLKEYNSDRKSDFMVGLNYFPCSKEENTGLHEHEDGNVFTFVLQDDAGGLQVKVGNEWIPVVPSPDKLVVNVGDCIQVLSNNRLKSATHRVLRPEGRTRNSFSFFHNLEGDKWVEPLPQFTTDIGEPPKYKGFFYKEYQALRLKNKTHPPAKPEDEIRITHYAI